MRVDALAKYFDDLTPKPSKSHDHLYNQIWNPADYPVAAAHEHSEASSHEKKPEEEKQA